MTDLIQMFKHEYTGIRKNIKLHQQNRIDDHQKWLLIKYKLGWPIKTLQNQLEIENL